MKDSGIPALHLDLGNFAAVKTGTETVRTPFLWQALSDLEVDATTVGPAELAQWALIDSLERGLPIPMVTSNLFRTSAETDSSAGTPPTVAPAGERTLLLERGGIRVGLLALLDPAEVERLPAEERARWVVTDPRSCLVELLPGLRQRSDLVVLLSQMPPGMTDEILASIKGVDLALYGLRAPVEESARRIGGTAVLEAGAKGQYLGRLKLQLGAAHEIRKVAADTRALDRSFPEDPVWSLRVAHGVAEVDSALAAARRRDQEAFDALFK